MQKKKQKQIINIRNDNLQIFEEHMDTINNFVSNFTTEMKWTNFLKDTNYQNSLKKKHMMCLYIFLK